MQLNFSILFPLLTPAVLRNISGSQAEHGPRAGQITWRNAMSHAEYLAPLTDEQMAAGRAYFAEYGAWDDEEIADWTNLHLRAMLVQEVAAVLREWGISSLTTEAEWPTAEDPRSGQLPFLLIDVTEWDPRTRFARTVIATFAH